MQYKDSFKIEKNTKQERYSVNLCCTRG